MKPFETERLRIRNFEPDDAADLLAYLHQPTSHCFMALALADLDAARSEARARSSSNDYLAICLKDGGRVIGDVFGVAEPSDTVDQSDTVAVGWNLNPHFGKVGYAIEAARGLFADLFSVRNARRLYAYVDEGNAASERLCERLGMRQEGVFREYVSFVNDAHGKPVFENTKQYAILRHEWTRGADASRTPAP